MHKAPLALLLTTILATGCTSPQYKPSDNAVTDLGNISLRDDQRIEAAERAWAEADPSARRPLRDQMKQVAWSRKSPEAVRVRVIDLLMSDETEAGQADSVRLAGLMLPNETSAMVTRHLCAAAIEHNWTDLTGPIVRSYARADAGSVNDMTRPERLAIERLHPGEPPEVAIYRVFLDPGQGPSGSASSKLGWAERARGDAWTLLSRLDRDGTLRDRLIDSGEGGAVVEDLRVARAQLGALPSNAAELAWLRALLHNKLKKQADRNGVWWIEATGAITMLGAEQRRGLAMRHAEPVRWASEHKPDWLHASRDQLVGEMASRIAGRTRHRRSAESGGARVAIDERLGAWGGQLAWGDVLAMLVIDEALSTPGLSGRVFQQSELDRKDRTTEYGGVLEAFTARDGAESFRVVLHKPRQGDRTLDTRFVASSDMQRFSDRALAHFHMHVQQLRNEKYAGPSPEDLVYAHNSGRTCLVFTSVAKDAMNVDCYLPGGAVIDLGDLKRDGTRR